MGWQSLLQLREANKICVSVTTSGGILSPSKLCRPIFLIRSNGNLDIWHWLSECYLFTEAHSVLFPASSPVESSVLTISLVLSDYLASIYFRFYLVYLSKSVLPGFKIRTDNYEEKKSTQVSFIIFILPGFSEAVSTHKKEKFNNKNLCPLLNLARRKPIKC